MGDASTVPSMLTCCRCSEPTSAAVIPVDASSTLERPTSTPNRGQSTCATVVSPLGTFVESMATVCCVGDDPPHAASANAMMVRRYDIRSSLGVACGGSADGRRDGRNRDRRMLDLDDELIVSLVGELHDDHARWIVHVPEDALPVLIERPRGDDPRNARARCTE